jgi:hypothetical protein
MQALLLEILREIPDHRRREGKWSDLSTVLLDAILAGAILTGRGMKFIRTYFQRLNEAFGLGLPIRRPTPACG